jgi:hypothetical protein
VGRQKLRDGPHESRGAVSGQLRLRQSCERIGSRNLLLAERGGPGCPAGQAYRARLQQLPPDKKRKLQGEQREWLARRAKECIIYKWWVDCLQELYTKRIAELNQP